jgi:hypothetical protein
MMPPFSGSKNELKKKKKKPVWKQVASGQSRKAEVLCSSNMSVGFQLIQFTLPIITTA